MLVAVFSGTWLTNSFKTNVFRCSPRFSLIGCNFGWPLYEAPHSRLAIASVPNIARGNFFLEENLPEIWFLKNESNRGANSINTAFVLCQRPYEHQHKRLKQKHKVFSKLFTISIFLVGHQRIKKCSSPPFWGWCLFKFVAKKKHAVQSPRKWDMFVFGWQIPWTTINCSQATLPWAWLAASPQKPGYRVVELLDTGCPGCPPHLRYARNTQHTHTHTHTPTKYEITHIHHLILN